MSVNLSNLLNQGAVAYCEEERGDVQTDSMQSATILGPRFAMALVVGLRLNRRRDWVGSQLQRDPYAGGTGASRARQRVDT